VWHTPVVMDSNRVLGKRILLVDDEPAVRRILTLLLSQEQYLVTPAAHGKEAFRLFAAGQFDLVVTDYEMPEMKGDELARTIKALVPSQRIIMLTGTPWGLEQPDNPVDEVLIKPIGLEALRQAVARVLSRPSENLVLP